MRVKEEGGIAGGAGGTGGGCRKGWGGRWEDRNTHRCSYNKLLR